MNDDTRISYSKYIVERKVLIMKVEFIVNYELGNGEVVLIEGSEFLKADKDDNEFNNLGFAIDAFTCCAGFKTQTFLYRDCYDDLKKIVSKTSTIVFSIEGKRTRLRLDIYISEKNKLQRVMCIDKNGYVTYDEAFERALGKKQKKK